MLDAGTYPNCEERSWKLRMFFCASVVIFLWCYLAVTFSKTKRTVMPLWVVVPPCLSPFHKMGKGRTWKSVWKEVWETSSSMEESWMIPYKVWDVQHKLQFIPCQNIFSWKKSPDGFPCIVFSTQQFRCFTLISIKLNGQVSSKKLDFCITHF